MPWPDLQHIPSVDLLMDAVFAASRPGLRQAASSKFWRQGLAARGFLSRDAGFVHLAHNYVRHDCPGLPLSDKRWRKCGFNSSSVVAGSTGACRDPDALEVARLWRTHSLSTDQLRT